MRLPPVLAKSIITPFEIANSKDINNKTVTNILVFLQSLDEDGNPNNGIQIPQNVTAAANV